MNNLFDLIIHFHKPIVLACSVLLVALLLLRRAEKRGRLSKVFLLVIILAMAAVIYPARGDMTLSIPSMLVLLTALFNLFQNWKPADAPVPVKEQGEGIRQYEERLRVIEQRLLAMQTGDAVLDDKERHRLEQELKAVQEKLANLQHSYEVEVTHRRYVEKSLAKLEGQLPSARIAVAKSLAQKDTQAAEQAFDEVVKEEGKLVAFAAYKSGQLAEGRVDYAKAMRQYEKAVTLKKDDWDYLFAAGRMANILADYNRAQNWLERLVALIGEAGKDDLDLVFIPLTLASIYVNMEHYEKAEPLYKCSLGILEKSLGKDHPDVANTLNNLAFLYDAQGRNEEAEPLYKRALEIKEKSLGKDHPEVATTLNNLAELYRAQDRYEEAETLYKRSLEIRENKLGKDHPDVAATLNNLALLYGAQNRYEEAEPLFQRAIAVMQAIFPDGHPNLDTFQANYDALKKKMAEKQ